MKYSLILMLALLSLASKCDKNQEDVKILSYNEMIVMAPGDKIGTAGTPTDGFQLVGITAESRCPRGVNCVRAGEVKFEVMTSDGQTHEAQYPAASRGQTPGFNLPNGDFMEVQKVDPYPEGSAKIDPASYRVTFVLRPASQSAQ